MTTSATMLHYSLNEYNTMFWSVRKVTNMPEGWQGNIITEMDGLPTFQQATIGVDYDSILCADEIFEGGSIAEGQVELTLVIPSMLAKAKAEIHINEGFNQYDEDYLMSYLLKHIMELYQCDFYYNCQ